MASSPTVWSAHSPGVRAAGAAHKRGEAPGQRAKVHVTSRCLASCRSTRRSSTTHLINSRSQRTYNRPDWWRPTSWESAKRRRLGTARNGTSQNRRNHRSKRMVSGLVILIVFARQVLQPSQAPHLLDGVVDLLRSDYALDLNRVKAGFDRENSVALTVQQWRSTNRAANVNEHPSASTATRSRLRVRESNEVMWRLLLHWLHDRT